MDKKELNAKLYDKMTKEQTRYRNWLLDQPPAEILHHAYEYSVREDIMMAMETHDLTESQAKALLRSSAPLADVVKEWNKQDCDYMADIKDTIENWADHLVQREQQRARSEGAR